MNPGISNEPAGDTVTITDDFNQFRVDGVAATDTLHPSAVDAVTSTDDPNQSAVDDVRIIDLTQPAVDAVSIRDSQSEHSPETSGSTSGTENSSSLSSDSDSITGSRISESDLVAVLALLPGADQKMVKKKLIEMVHLYPVRYLDATVDFFLERPEYQSWQEVPSIATTRNFLDVSPDGSEASSGINFGETRQQDKCRECAKVIGKCTWCLFHYGCLFKPKNFLPSDTAAASDTIRPHALTKATSVSSSNKARGNIEAGAWRTGEKTDSAGIPSKLSGLTAPKTVRLSNKLSGTRRVATGINSPLAVPRTETGNDIQPAASADGKKKSADTTVVRPSSKDEDTVDQSSLRSGNGLKASLDLPAIQVKSKYGKKFPQGSKRSFQDYLTYKSAVDRGEFQGSRAEERCAMAETSQLESGKRCRSSDELDQGKGSGYKQTKRESQDNFGSAAAASAHQELYTVALEGEKWVASLQETGATSQPFFMEEEDADLAGIPDEWSCDHCGTRQSPDHLAQCGDGHLLCQPCLDRVVRPVLMSEKESLDLECPVASCVFTVSFVQAKRVLYPLVGEMLEHKVMMASHDTMKNMDTVIACPECGQLACVDVSIAVFQCNACSGVCCRYCRKGLNEKDHRNCSMVTCTPDSMSDIVSLPSSWAPMPENLSEGYMKVVLDPTSEEYVKVYDMWQQTAGPEVCVTSIARIQNKQLWQKFALTRVHMIKDLGGSNLNERLLYHGTGRCYVDSICKEGFDWRVCGTNGTVYGQGCYFAVNSCYSVKFCKEQSLSPYAHLRIMRRQRLALMKQMKSSSIDVVFQSLSAPITFPEKVKRLYASSVRPEILTVAKSVLGNMMVGTNNDGTPSNAEESIRLGAVNAELKRLNDRQPRVTKEEAANQLLDFYWKLVSTLNPSGIVNPPSVTAASLVQQSGGYGTSTTVSSAAFPVSSVALPSSVNPAVFMGTSGLSGSSPWSQLDVTMYKSSHVSQSMTTTTASATASTADEEPAGVKKMFVARVLCGRTTRGSGDMRRPPKDPSDPQQRLFNSTCDRDISPSMFVVYDSDQTYPEYLISFTNILTDLLL